MMSGACTLAIMILPLIMRTAEEALKSVPDSYREASFGLGAGKLRTIFKIVLPSAVPGILFVSETDRLETDGLRVFSSPAASASTAAFAYAYPLSLHPFPQ